MTYSVHAYIIRIVKKKVNLALLWESVGVVKTVAYMPSQRFLAVQEDQLTVAMGYQTDTCLPARILKRKPLQNNNKISVPP